MLFHWLQNMLWRVPLEGHNYQNIWDPVIDEALTCVREDGNPHDQYIVAVNKGT